MNPKGCEREVCIMEIERSWRGDSDIFSRGRGGRCVCWSTWDDAVLNLRCEWLTTLNLFCIKTKVDVEPSFREDNAQRGGDDCLRLLRGIDVLKASDCGNFEFGIMDIAPTRWFPFWETIMHLQSGTRSSSSFINAKWLYIFNLSIHWKIRVDLYQIQIMISYLYFVTLCSSLAMG